ncbi:hypothetical protein AAEX37_02070 [Oligella sp. MSHR50489EDL]
MSDNYLDKYRKGRNVFEENKIRYNERKEAVYQEIIKEVKFIK